MLYWEKRFISLCLATKVYSFFSNGVSPSSYGGHPRAMLMAYIVLGASRAYLTNNSQGGNPCLVLRFSSNNACLLEAALFTNVGLGYFCSNFILKKFN